MRSFTRTSFLSVLAVFFLLLSACAPSSASPALSGGSDKVQASMVEFTGVITAMDGNVWTINGQAVTVDAQTAAATQFTVGDSVRIRGQVAPDGSVTAQQVESASVEAGNDNSGNANGADDNSNNSNTSNSNDANSNDANSNSGGSNSNDDNGNGNQSGEDQKVTGVVEAINGNQITIAGVTYTVASSVDLSGIAVGDTVTIEVVANPDGTQTITEIKPGAGDDGSSNTNGSNSNDDQGSNGNNDNGGNSNDGNGNGGNGNGGGGNGNGGGGGGNGNGG